MTNRKQKTAIVLTGAIALASGAYALGSQAGDGSAVAADKSGATAAADEVRAAGAPGIVHFRRGGPPPGLDGLADRLGVEESKLRDALEDVRGQMPDPREAFAQDLAKELGVEASKIQAALERVRERHEQQAEQRRAQLAERLADRLNLDPDEVEEALGDGPFGHHPAPPRRP